jgi:uncharacterized membrane protein YcaP (DUF421 family)
MIILSIRTFIVYCLVAVFIRIMGKRQLGELQPGELVITILISEIAAAPITDIQKPFLHSLIPLMLLVSFEIISSLFNLKSVKFRTVIEGNPVTVIRNGEVQQKQLKRLRFTINDILAALRQKDIFDIEDVEFAVIETNGTLSVLLKPDKRNSTPSNYDKPEKDNGMPCPVIIDGKIISNNFKDCLTSHSEIESILKRKKTPLKNVVLMTLDKNKSINIIEKDD